MLFDICPHISSTQKLWLSTAILLKPGCSYGQNNTVRRSFGNLT